MRSLTFSISWSYLFAVVVILGALSRKALAAPTSGTGRCNYGKSASSTEGEKINVDKFKSAVYSALIRAASYILRSLPEGMKTRRRKSKCAKKSKRPITNDSFFEEFD